MLEAINDLGNIVSTVSIHGKPEDDCHDVSAAEGDGSPKVESNLQVPDFKYVRQ